MSTPGILHVTLPGLHPRLPGRRLRIIAGLWWADLPPGSAGRAQLPSRRGQWLKLATSAGPYTRRTAFTPEPGHLWSLAVLATGPLDGNGYAFVRNGSNISFVACVRGAPALVGDITGPKATVEQALQTFLQLHKRDLPPQGWTVIGSVGEPVDVHRVLPDKLPRHARLRPVNFHTRLTVLFLLLSLLTGACLWMVHHNQQQQDARLAAARAQQANTETRVSGPVRQRELPPWPQQPDIRTFMSTCLPVMKQLDATLAGWKLTAAECLRDGFRAEYTRPETSIATFAAFREAARTRPWVDAIVLDDSNGGKAQLQHRWNIAGGGDQTLLAEDDTLATFLLPFQATNRPVRLEKQPDTQSRIVVINGQDVELYRDWYEWHFTLSERMRPDQLTGWSLPAARITSVSVTLSDDDEITWKTEGNLWSLKKQAEEKHDPQ